MLQVTLAQDFVHTLESLSTVEYLERIGVVPVGSVDARKREINKLRAQIVMLAGEEHAQHLEKTV